MEFMLGVLFILLLLAVIVLSVIVMFINVSLWSVVSLVLACIGLMQIVRRL